MKRPRRVRLFLRRTEHLSPPHISKRELHILCHYFGTKMTYLTICVSCFVIFVMASKGLEPLILRRFVVFSGGGTEFAMLSLDGFL